MSRRIGSSGGTCVVLLALGLLFTTAGAVERAPVQTPPAPGVTILLVRHGEKAAGDPKDPRNPDLSDAGRARAAALATLLADAGVTHLFASEFKRTQQSLAPLAAATKLNVETTPGADVKALVAKLVALPPGSVAVVAGHSDTLPDLAKALGGEMTGVVDIPGGRSTGKMLPDAEYDRVTLLLLPAQGVTTLRLHYGAR